MVQPKKSQKWKWKGLSLTGPGGIIQHLSRGHRGKSRQVTSRERETGTGNVPLEGSLGRMFWGSQTRARLVNPNHKEWGFGQIHGNLI